MSDEAGVIDDLATIANDGTYQAIWTAPQVVIPVFYYATPYVIIDGTPRYGQSRRVRVSQQCGNLAMDEAEGCDDGNVVSGDGCSADCQLEEARCGDGNLGDGEQCDDGNLIAGDGCNPDCQIEARCGDGNVDNGEQCDDGNLIAGDGCNPDCQEEVCVPGSCDDQNECTDDLCDPVTGCLNSPLMGACDDGDPNTADDVCVGDDLYWAEFLGGAGSQIWRFSLTEGGDPVVVQDGLLDRMGGLGTDGEWLYITRARRGIYRLPINGGEVETIFEDGTYDIYTALDDEFVGHPESYAQAMYQ